MEAYETRGVVQEQLVMIAIGVLSAAFALARQPSLSRMSYTLIGPLQAWIGGARHGKRRRILAEEMA
jgi:hypothetical protein